MIGFPEVLHRDAREKKAHLFFAARKKGGDGTGFFAEKKTSPVSEPRRGSLVGFFFRGSAGPGRDWFFYFAGRDGTGFFFFVERLAWGRDWIFFFETGLDFSLLEQSAKPRSKDSQRKSRPTGKPSSNEKSSPVSEACRGGLVGFFFRG